VWAWPFHVFIFCKNKSSIRLGDPIMLKLLNYIRVILYIWEEYCIYERNNVCRWGIIYYKEYENEKVQWSIYYDYGVLRCYVILGSLYLLSNPRHLYILVTWNYLVYRGIALGVIMNNNYFFLLVTYKISY